MRMYSCTYFQAFNHPAHGTEAHLWRYSAREMTRAAKVLMLIKSMGEMSCPMLVFAASMIACAVSSSPAEFQAQPRQLW